MATQSPEAKYCRTEQLVNWQCGDLGHLRGDCLQEHPERDYLGGVQPRSETHAGEDAKKALISLLHPLMSHPVCQQMSNDGLTLRDKSCLGTTDTGTSMSTARSDITIGLSKEN
jgi:hypothetical protein